MTDEELLLLWRELAPADVPQYLRRLLACEAAILEIAHGNKTKTGMKELATRALYPKS